MAVVGAGFVDFEITWRGDIFSGAQQSSSVTRTTNSLSLAKAGAPVRRLMEAWAILRSEGAPRYERLIPPSSPTPFVLGLERWPHAAHTRLVATVEPASALSDPREGAGVPAR